MLEGQDVRVDLTGQDSVSCCSSLKLVAARVQIPPRAELTPFPGRRGPSWGHPLMGCLTEGSRCSPRRTWDTLPPAS